MFQVIILSVFVNLFLFFSIFDIHFQSTIVQVNRHHRLNQEVPFKRVLFYSADGLRAETFISHPEYRPYMSKLIESDSCVWGIVDTRVPSESRPGHAALFAGIHEDPSGIFTGWEEFSVPVDSIFNQTAYAVGIGPDDQIKKYANMTSKHKMFSITYDDKRLGFSENAGIAAEMDSWVMDNFRSILKNTTLKEKGPLLIFLHFLALDKMGQNHLPESEEYNNAMKLIDSIVNESQKRVEEYFKDDRTLFVLSADHGISNEGHHGQGSAEETQVPFVIWGKGIKNNGEPQSLRQVDIAPLLAAALGVAYPSNNLGRFPTSFWSDQSFALEALKVNFLQLLELMMTKKQVMESSRNLPIIEFSKEDVIMKMNSTIRNSDSSGAKRDIAKEINEINEAIELTLKGIAYYEGYERYLPTTIAGLSTICWIFIVCFVILEFNSSYHEYKTVRIIRGDFLVLAILSAVLLICGIIGWNFRRIPYGIFLIYMTLILSNILRDLVASSTDPNPTKVAQNDRCTNTLLSLLLFTMIAAVILGNSFEKRGLLSLGLVLSALWCTWAKKMSRSQNMIFFAAVSFLAVFPLMLVIGPEKNSFFITIGPVASVILIFIIILQFPKGARRHHVIILCQMILLIATSRLLHFPQDILASQVAWLSLFLSYILPLFVSAETLSLRIISLFLGIACPLSFIAFSHEVLFFLCLFLVLFFFLKVEISGEESWTDFLTLSIQNMKRRKIWERVDLHQAVRIAWLHLFFTTLSFFGVENISSVNLLDPTGNSAKRFVTVFGPWLKTILIEKVVGPFILVSCVFRRLLWSRFEVERHFLIVLLLSQGLTLHTYLNVKNEGTWLAIGTSICHHIIASVATLGLIVLYLIADFILWYDPWYLCTNLSHFSKTSVKAVVLALFVIVLYMYFNDDVTY